MWCDLTDQMLKYWFYNKATQRRLYFVCFSVFSVPYLTVSVQYVMQSRGISRKSNACDIFNILFDWGPHLERYILLKTTPESDQWFQSYSNWKILKTIENKRNAFLFLALSHNRCCRLLTDPARSQHICDCVQWNAHKISKYDFDLQAKMCLKLWI